jgi:beta-lactamase regulating signal transducer with metallopeptidase domain
MLNAAPWFDDPRSLRLGLCLVHFLWQGALAGLLAGMLLLAMRRASPQRRYAVLLLVFGAMPALPIATFAVLNDSPRFGSQNLMEPERPVTVATSGGESAAGPGDQSTFSVFAPATQSRPRTSPISSPSASVLNPVTTWSDLFSAAWSWPHRHISWIVAAWTLGVCLCSLRLAIGLAGARRLRRIGLAPAGAPCLQLCDELARRFKISRAVLVFESVLVRAPVVAGWTAPMILLPASVVTGLSTAQLRAILAHEMAHICRHDYLVNVWQTVVETLLFYHPAVWWLSGALRNEREHCCDELAAEVCQDKLIVARALASLAAIDAVPGPAVLAANGGKLVRRIRRLLSAEGAADPRTDWQSTGALFLGLLLLASTIVLAGAPARSPAGDGATQPRTGATPAKPTVVADRPELGEGWKEIVDVPKPRFPGDAMPPRAKVTLWEEQGWLVVRRNDPQGEVEWQVVLAQAIKDTRPLVRVDKQFGSLEITYGRYFVRDGAGRLRLLRQRKEAGSPAWPSLKINGTMRSAGLGGASSPFQERVELKGWLFAGGCWAMSGPPDNRYDVWVKLGQRDLSGKGYGFGGGIADARIFYGDAEAVDEGDLFWANRFRAEDSQHKPEVQKARESE